MSMWGTLHTKPSLMERVPVYREAGRTDSAVTNSSYLVTATAVKGKREKQLTETSGLGRYSRPVCKIHEVSSEGPVHARLPNEADYNTHNRPSHQMPYSEC